MVGSDVSQDESSEADEVVDADKSVDVDDVLDVDEDDVEVDDVDVATLTAVSEDPSQDEAAVLWVEVLVAVVCVETCCTVAS